MSEVPKRKTLSERRKCHCANCQRVVATGSLVIADARPAGPGINNQSVEMWNKVLEESPCLDEVDSGEPVSED